MDDDFKIFPPAGICRKETVVVVHGLFERGFWMYPVARHLAASGYTAAVYSYPTTRARLAGHAERFSRAMEKLLQKYPEHKISFAGHSLGGLMIRSMLEKTEIPAVRRGRIFFMGVPHKGSPVARWVRKWLFFADRLVKVGPDLDNIPVPGQVELAPRPDWEFASAIARFDGLVPLRSSLLPGAAARRVFKTTHCFMIFNKNIHRALVNFLSTGEMKN